jgi:hypothetical protein
MNEQTIRQVSPREQAEYEREIERILEQLERLDKSIEQHQDETRRSRERTLATLSKLKSE